MSRPVAHVRFCRSRDGTRIAYETCGTGPPIIWVQHWIHHLQFDWDNPIWRHWLQFLTKHHALIRYDWRGCGLSDRDGCDFGAAKLTDDLEAVVEAAGADRFALFGMSGAGGAVAVEYATRHPDQVSRLMLHGCLTKGRWAGRPSPQMAQEGEARLKVYELGWSSEAPAYDQFFTALHIPDAGAAQKAAHKAMLRQATSAVNATALLRSFYSLDLRKLLPRVSCPTLVIHARGDSVIPFEEGRKVAALVPGARFVSLASRNHLLLEGEPAWQQFTSEVEQFLPQPAEPMSSLFASLTAREREVLAALAEGLDNNAIAARLNMSAKTARNHLSIIFGKLGVRNRAQAIILARNSGLGRQGTA